MSETDGVQPIPAPAERPQLGEFITQHQPALRNAMAAALRGRADVDDALQQAYLRLINEYERWPADQSPEDRLAFAHRTIHLAAKDALRQEFGRSDRAPKPRAVAVDFTADSRNQAQASDDDGIQLLAQQRLSETASRYPGDEEHLDHALKVAALAALDPIAHHIVTASRLGLNHKQIAKRLGLTHQTVRAKDSEARALLLSLIACARGRDVREATEVNLFGYLEGQKLSRAERRLVQGHLKHCTNCQEIAVLATEVDSVAQRLALPLPLVLAAGPALRQLLGGATSGHSSAVAMRSGAAPFGSVAGGGNSSGIAFVGSAKLVAGLSALAMVGGGAIAAIEMRQGKPPAAARVAGNVGATRLAGPRKKVPTPTKPSPSRRTGSRRQASRRRQSQHHTRARAPRSTSPPVTRVVSPPAAPPPIATTHNSAPAVPESSARGGEFVLGGGG